MFVTFEGIDGSGKSTQAALFWKWLVEEKKRDALLTREPGGWPGGNVLREIVISGKLKHDWSEAYLFMLDRAEHVASVIQPAIDSGRDIVCERYHDSTLAYPDLGQGTSPEIFDELAKLSAFPVPDLTVPLRHIARMGFEESKVKGRSGFVRERRSILYDKNSRRLSRAFKTGS